MKKHSIIYNCFLSDTHRGKAYEMHHISTTNHKKINYCIDIIVHL